MSNKFEDKLKQLENKISELESDAKLHRAVLKKKFDAETYSELKETTGELDDLKRRLKLESEMKEKYRKKYSKSFASEGEFEFLWNSELRDKAMAESAEDETDLSETMRHPIYSKF